MHFSTSVVKEGKEDLGMQPRYLIPLKADEGKEGEKIRENMVNMDVEKAREKLEWD